MNKTDLAIYIQNEEQLRRAESLLDRIEQERNYTGMVELAGILEELHNDNLEEEICALYTEAARAFDMRMKRHISEIRRRSMFWQSCFRAVTILWPCTG